MHTLLIINGPAYGSDASYNAVRLAVALAKKEGQVVHVSLMGDGSAWRWARTPAQVTRPRRRNDGLRPGMEGRTP